MSDRRYPSLYQINTRVRLTDLSRKLDRAATWMTFQMPDWIAWQNRALTASGF
jgi:hypothetical protein